MPVVVLRNGARVHATRVVRDGTAVLALCVQERTVVDEGRREAWREPVGQLWRSWPARDVRTIHATEDDNA